jgi:glycine cleavage system aminomethyltransferase T
MPALVPAVYDGDEMTAFREWLPASAIGSLGGSYYSQDIADYYVSPYDLGYGRVIAFDHDFYGRDGLEARSSQPSREKVTLVWNEDDLQRAIGASLRAEGTPAKYMEFPKARYATHQYDTVLDGDDIVGISSDCGYIANERCFVSLATVDAGSAERGTEVVVVWGESPNSTKPGVEPHGQVKVRATVAPAPMPTFARTTYRAG